MLLTTSGAGTHVSPSTVQYGVRNRVAEVVLANPPVNALAWDVRRAIIAAVDQANASESVQAIVLAGARETFSAGADIREFESSGALIEPTLRTVIACIEDSSKPVVAAVSGACMGGGLELALACHYRVAAIDALIALPEVRIGLIPGAGGTQRLPRAIGVERALDMIVSGTSKRAKDLSDGVLFDVVTEGDVRDAAMSFAGSIIGKPMPRLRDRAVALDEADGFFQFARDTVVRNARGAPAPVACVDAVAASVHLPFDRGLTLEYDLFARLLASDEARALRHAFLAERAAGRVPDVPKATAPRVVASVGIVGGGTMGTGIAIAFLSVGLPITLLEVDRVAMERATSAIRVHFEGSLQRGKITAEQRDRSLALLRSTVDFADLHACDLVIEAVFENVAIKNQVFQALDRAVKPGAILATNTSMLDVNRIASATARPRDVVGMHFFSPAPVMRLVEVVRGDETAADVLVTAMQVARLLGKTAVVARVCDGFIGNRMLEPYLAQAMALLDEGATPAQVDLALERFGMAMGPFRMCDLAGNDVGWHHRQRRYVEYPGMPRARAADLLCEAGRFGQKTGAGWYFYPHGTRKPMPDPAVDAVIDRARSEQGLVARNIDDAEIVDRCILALVNEGARVLEDGIAARASDIDVVYLTGYGFPRWRGGPMFYAEQRGIFNVVRRMKQFADNPHAAPAFWTPAPLLAGAADRGATLQSLAQGPQPAQGAGRA